MADVGTDHGTLPAALIQAGTVPRAIGIDRRPAPLRAASARLGASAVDARLALRLGDGLSPLAPGEVATVVIAGMGGARTVGLLRSAPAVVQRLERLVLQPNTAWPQVRGGLAMLGWQIVDEVLVEAGGRAFLTLCAEPGAASLSERQALLGPVLLHTRPAAFLRWLDREQTRLQRALASARDRSATAKGAAATASLARALTWVQAALGGEHAG